MTTMVLHYPGNLVEAGAAGVPRRGGLAPAAGFHFPASWARCCPGESAVPPPGCWLGSGPMAFGMAIPPWSPLAWQVSGPLGGIHHPAHSPLAFGGLLGFPLASGFWGRGGMPTACTRPGALVGGWGRKGGPRLSPGDNVAAGTGSSALFLVGTFLVAFGGALLSCPGPLMATMTRAPADQAGLASRGVGGFRPPLRGWALGPHRGPFAMLKWSRGAGGTTGGSGVFDPGGRRLTSWVYVLEIHPSSR